MALFNKEPEKNVRPEPPKPQVQPVQPAPPPTQTASVQREQPPVQREERPVAPQPRPNGPLNQTTISSSPDGRAYLDKGCKISGKLFFEGPTRVDGQVDGEIGGNDVVTIGETAVVTAQVKATSVVIAGKVSGDITATKRIEIRPSAKVMGNLVTPILVVQEGAIFEGHCTMAVDAKDDRKVTLFPREERLAAESHKTA